MSVPDTLAACWADAFATVFAFRGASNEERPGYRPLRSRLLSVLSEGKQSADELGVDPRGDAHYAVVALVDETIMSSDWEHAADWGKEPLQVQLFGEFLAGEEFFRRLDRVIDGGEPALLDVYFTCMCAGFRGMYRDDPDALAARRRKVYGLLKTVDLRDEAHLTEPAYGRHLERSIGRSRFPFWWVLPFAGAAVFTYAAYWVILGRQVSDISRLAG